MITFVFICSTKHILCLDIQTWIIFVQYRKNQWTKTDLSQGTSPKFLTWKMPPEISALHSSMGLIEYTIWICLNSKQKWTRVWSKPTASATIWKLIYVGEGHEKYPENSPHQLFYTFDHHQLSLLSMDFVHHFHHLFLYVAAHSVLC